MGGCCCDSDAEEEAKEGRNKGREREATTDEEVRSPRLTPVCVWGGGVFRRVKTAPQLRLE